jgi:hypothetical protein
MKFVTKFRTFNIGTQIHFRYSTPCKILGVSKARFLLLNAKYNRFAWGFIDFTNCSCIDRNLAPIPMKTGCNVLIGVEGPASLQR